MMTGMAVAPVDPGAGLSTAIQPPHVDEARDYGGDDEHEHDQLADQTIAQRHLLRFVRWGRLADAPVPGIAPSICLPTHDVAHGNGLLMRVSRFFPRPRRVAGPPEPDTCLGSALQNDLTLHNSWRTHGHNY